MNIVDNLVFSLFLISPIFITMGIIFIIEEIKDRKEIKNFFKNDIDK